MTPTKRFMNWLAVTFTPTSGSAITITGVTGVEIDPGGNIAAFSGDGDQYNTTVVHDFSDPTVTVSSADLGALRSLTPGTRGTFSATHGDANNQAAIGGGAMIYALSNAIVGNNPTGGQHRQFGAGTLTIRAWSPDGTTNPLTTSLA